MRTIQLLTAALLTRCLPLATQCSFPVTLITSPNACLGSTLRVNSPHAITKIVWYQANPIVTAIYILQVTSPGGPTDSIVHVFDIFNRWGARVFNAQDISPGDSSHAWDSTIAGRPTPAGTYVYIIVMTLPGVSRQVYKGTIELIR